jgi:hypothetical protein
MWDCETTKRNIRETLSDINIGGVFSFLIRPPKAQEWKQKVENGII